MFVCLFVCVLPGATTAAPVKEEPSVQEDVNVLGTLADDINDENGRCGPAPYLQIIELPRTRRVSSSAATVVRFLPDIVQMFLVTRPSSVDSSSILPVNWIQLPE